MVTFPSVSMRIVGLVLAGLLLSLHTAPAADCSCAVGKDVVQAKDVLDSWFIDFDTASLWKITNTTDLNYIVLPQIVSWRSRPFLHWELGNGDLVIRNRLVL